MSTHDPKPGLVWFRRDLRLGANPAWAAATASHEIVVALFVIEPVLMDRASALRRNQLLAHLRALDDELRALGGCLVVRSGPGPDAVAEVLRESEASALYLNCDPAPYSVIRDAALGGAVRVPIHAYGGLTVHEPGSVLTRKGTLSQVFSPFFTTWIATAPKPWPTPGGGKPAAMAGTELPAPDGPVRQLPGEANAWTRLTAWLERVGNYPTTRDLPAEAGTSELSADLKFGTIAARSIVDVIGTTSPGAAAFVRQLAWRDWWAHTLAQRPDLPRRALRPQYERIVWRDDDAGFEAWRRGATGYPIVDAGMRQLVKSGWMHNRVRMICASFLVKDLLIDWRRGELFFRHHLVDADVAQNAGNWQWVAGTGPDAAPYFRIFNPTSQSKKFDARGDYIRTWVPELAELPAPTIHEPGSMAPLELASYGVIIDDTYPAPIVDHGEARTRALAAYKRAIA